MSKQVIALSDVSVILLRNLDDIDLAKDLMERYHYLGSCRLRDEYLYHAASYKGHWLGVLSWERACERLSLRDEVIGWSATQRDERLGYVAHNRRFLLLPQYSGVNNLASRILSLSTARLSKDWQKRHRAPVLLAETFVDPERGYKGTCYKAAGWELIGKTKGYRRKDKKSGGYNTSNPKDCYHKMLHEDSYTILSSPYPHPILTGGKLHSRGSDNTFVIDPNKLDFEGLKAALSRIKDPRSNHGNRYDFLPVLVLSVAAVLAGQKGYKAIHQWISSLSVELLRKAGLKSGRRIGESALRTLLSRLDSENVDEIVGEWVQKQVKKNTGRLVIAFDGKTLRAGHKKGKNAPQLLSAVIHEVGVVVDQKAVSCKTNEIPVAQDMIEKLDVPAGTIFTGDALHTQTKTARIIVVKKKCHFVLSVKDNQKNLRQQILEMSPERFTTSHKTTDKGHGRIEVRTIKVAQVDPREFKFPFINQVAIVTREKTNLDGESYTKEVVPVISDLTSEQAPPSDLLSYNRGHWTIENCLHYVRDFTYDEDRCTIKVKNGPRIMASLRNIAISIIRFIDGNNVAEATRHFCFHPADAIRCVLL